MGLTGAALQKMGKKEMIPLFMESHYELSETITIITLS